MPPKTKKHSKTASPASRLSNSEQPSSPQTPSFREEDLSLSLEEASSRYPSLIGKSAFVGRVADVDPDPNKPSKIWLSESSMLSSSLAPGSVVSVSLATIGGRVSNGFPLSSISDEFCRKLEVDHADETANAAGNYFALATIFPSQKVSKDGVWLSSSLSFTMGCPAQGRIVFVYPIQNQPLTHLVNVNKKPPGTKEENLSLHYCELYLELVLSKDKAEINTDMISSIKFFAEKSHGQSENGILSSPKTPLSQSKFMSPSRSPFTSPRCNETVSSYPKGTYDGSFDIKDLLKDESAKQVLQACSASWLYARILLCGNLVAIPILSKLCFFRVVSVNGLPADNINLDLLKEAVFVNHETKVYLSLPMDSATEMPPGRGVPSMQIESKHVKTNAGHDISKLGGLSKEYATLKDIIMSSTKNTLSSFGLRPTKGVFLHGPPGTGKTSLARLCALDTGVNFFSVNGPEVVSQFHGESEQAIHEVFDSAMQAAPAVVFIDELDAIAPARKDGGDELSHRMVATLLNLMDGICRNNGLVVIAATNRPDSIEPALRRPGRLDREIEIGVPSPIQRFDILRTLLSEMKHSLSEAQIQHFAITTHGFVGADLAAFCNEAALVCLRRYAKSKKCCYNLQSVGSSIKYEGCSDSLSKESDCANEIRNLPRDCADSASLTLQDLPTLETSSCFRGYLLENEDSVENGSSTRSSSFRGTVSDNAVGIENDVITSTRDASLVEEQSMLIVSFEDFEKARMKIRPSAMREVILEVPKVNWEDVGGQREVKTQLMEAVEWPQRHQDAFKRIGTRPPTGILMFGPPGCSKTLMARAVASEAGLNFLAVKGPELFSKWVGESEKAVRSLFAKARANAPSIIFFDEIDGLAVIRGKESDGVSVSDRVMSQLLVEMDGLHQRVNVTVIAATNRPDKIDPALLRPGRFDRLIYVGPPNETDREEIFRVHLRKIPCSSDVSIKLLAGLSDGCTGADIALICREAAVAAMEENLDASEVTMEHLKAAISRVQPSEIHSYHELSAKFQRLVLSSNGGMD